TSNRTTFSAQQFLAEEIQVDAQVRVVEKLRVESREARELRDRFLSFLRRQTRTLLERKHVFAGSKAFSVGDYTSDRLRLEIRGKFLVIPRRCRVRRKE